jgi:hypothetical protein
MKTLIITGATPMPAELREVVARGSTSLAEHRASEFDPGNLALDVDRIVFWTGAGDTGVRELAGRYATAESAERREVIVFVTSEPDSAGPLRGLPPNEFFVWPRDEDRLKMAFLTGG